MRGPFTGRHMALILVVGFGIVIAVLGNVFLVVTGASSLSAFVAGAATSAILINWARRRALESEYALPLAVEAALLLLFGLSGLACGTDGRR